MIRTLIAYKDREPLSFFLVGQTINDVRERLLGPLPVIMQTAQGELEIDRSQAKQAIIQNLVNGKVSEQMIVRFEEGLKMADEGPVQEPEVTQDVAPEPVVEPVPVEEPQEVAKEDKPMPVDAKILNEKFRSFREKFLELENNQESWESQIIEKMAKREELLKNFAQTIDEENTALDAFKNDKIG